MTAPRARDLGLPFPGVTGPHNAITDVAGVRVGMTTLIDPARAMRTGVTAILPRPPGDMRPVVAGHHSLNGNGEMTGVHWIDHAGYFLGPVLVTNTHAIGAAHTGAVRWMIDTYSALFRDQVAWAMPVVAETYDGVLNDINAMFVTPDHAIAALNAASGGPVAEGAVGGGTGMIAYEFKAGTGTSSRRVALNGETYTVGALVQANHGRRPWFQVLGRPVGRLMPEGAFRETDTGSVIVVIATDAPLSALVMAGIARRAGLGIGRGGTPGGNSSGDIFLAFSTADMGPIPQLAGPVITRSELNQEHIDPIYLGAVEAVEEAVVNAIVAGEDTPMARPPGGVVRGIDRARLAALFRDGP